MNAPGRLLDLNDRVAMVVGGGGYLGRRICHHLVAHGAAVVVADHNLEAAESVRDEIVTETRDATVRAVGLDVADEAAITAVMAEVSRNEGGLDVLVNAATYSRGRSLEDATAEDWDAGLRVSLTGAFLLSRAAAGLMFDRGGGSIINFVTMYASVSPDPRAYPANSSVNPPDYGAAKAGLMQLTRYQAVMWAPRGVRVNAIAPGPFPNPTVQGEHPEMVRRLCERTPMGRIGQPDEIPGAVIYLASDASTYVTGTRLMVDGGWTAW